MKNELHYHYITDYSLDLCLEYMKHDNIYDKFEYVWEERGDYYLITFKEYKNGMLSLANAPKPTFKVTFKNMGNQTGISVQFIKGSLQAVPFVYTKDIDAFWKKKLDAKKADFEMDNNQLNNIPEEYRPISMWGYLGYELLFSIPFVGLILMMVFSFGGAKNINLRNFARSYFFYYIIIVFITILLVGILVFAGVLSGIK